MAPLSDQLPEMTPTSARTPASAGAGHPAAGPAGRVARSRQVLATVARLLLAGVWLWAGATKVGDLAGSVRAVRAYRLLPEGGAQVVGAGLPFLEITLGLLLLAGLGVRAGAVVSAVLLAVFVIGIASAASRGLRIDCGCFGTGGELAAGQDPRYGWDLARDGGLMVVSGLLAAWPASWLSVDRRLLGGGGAR